LQPRAEWILDITQTSEEIWQSFHKHARYNVRLAERVHAITTVYKPSDAPLDDFYALMQTTSSRDGFGIFDKSYYDSYLKSLDANDGFLVVTTIDDQPAAVGLFAVYDQQAHYVFAGSSNQFRKIAPAYAVIWSAIQEAQDRGCTQINFGGISDTVKGLDLHGVTSFKKRFGGYRVDHDNPVDFVYMPLKYSLFRLYKTVR
ncbi:peptidoglycan bridge formation glycyltransferase FemA/FemB family protein, partial [Candidatus Saccharibacteria bacterium]|nr:peptidoglycan bridge formation glycyltransferase FemA/FemB family protein [Candidatus Saccharibacteria bacterium]